MTDLPIATVTIADLYRELVGMRADITRALTRIEVIDSRSEEADRLHADHETRLRALERFRFTVAGYALAGGSVMGIIGSFIAQAWIHH